MNKEAILYLVRHGQSEGNVKGVASGSTDHPITPLGEQQAINLGKKLNHINFDKVFSSDLTRARRTAELILLDRKLEISTTKALRERNFGELEGESIAELHKLFDSWNKFPYTEQLKFRPPNGESGEEVISRFITFLREIAIGYPDNTILITTHGSVMYSFITHLGYAKDEEIKKVNNTAWIKVISDGIDFQINEMEGVVIEYESKSINN